MPTDPSDCESSPSLLGNLKRFEYQHFSKRNKHPKGVTYTDNDHSSNDPDSRVPSPETTNEGENHDQPSAASNGHISDGGLDEYSQQESPLMRVSSCKGKRRITSDSENEEPNSRTMKRTRPLEFGPKDMEDPELFTDKELGIRILMSTFPKADVTVLTELLMKTRWNAHKAVRIYRGEIVSDDDSEPVAISDKKEATTENELESRYNSQINYRIDVEKSRTSKDSEEKSLVRTMPVSKAHGKTHELSDDEESIVSKENVFKPRGKLHVLSDEEDDCVASESKVLHPRVEVHIISDDDESLITEVKVHPTHSEIHKLSDDEESVVSEEKIPHSASKMHILSDESTDNVISKEPVCPARGKTHELSDDDRESVVRVEKVRKAPRAISDDENGVESPVPQTSKKAVHRRNKAIVKKSKKRNHRDEVVDSDCEDYARDNSTDSEDSDIDDTMTPARAAVFDILQEGTVAELASIPGCSKKKAEVIMQCRPFKGWADLVRKFQNSKQLTRTLLSKVKDVIYARDVMKKLMKRCERISLELETMMSDLLEEDSTQERYIEEQPALLTKKMRLSPYQLIGLNWLYLMHKQQLNGILADEMGLGKTIQAIAFLAYLQMTKEKGRHLIVVPSSTLDNWLHEFDLWCPSLIVLCYHGSQEERKEIRMQIVNEEIEWDIMVTTYNMVSSSLEDRGLFRRLKFHYVIFDEAHMLKNMGSQRYQNLMRIVARRRLLLTGTPLQNNLVELMSLLIFVMPGMFFDKIDQVKQMFATVSKSEEDRGKYERERIQHAKRIMKPFVLRRLKSEVLQQLPTKHEETVFCAMSPLQQVMYENLVQEMTTKVKNTELKTSGTGMMMELRKAANHPLLIRKLYTDEVLLKISKLMLQEPTHCDANPNLIFEDMQVMSDFEITRLCKMYKSVSSFQLEDDKILDSGKFKQLDKVLSKWKESDSRVLLFSQFTMMLDIIEVYMKIRNYKYLRLDGQTPVPERQDLIDKFNENEDIFIFLLSTKAGGLGINLTAANVVIIHDIDFNPYNDKQAEDRCHRVGQMREVHVSRIICKNTIEEGMLQIAQEKLRLEKDITTGDNDEEEDLKCVTTLLKQALGM